MKKLLVALVALMIAAPLGGCTDPDAASRRALQGMGFSDIKTEYDLWGFGCGQDDWSRKFTATGPTGRQVSGNVCGAYIGKNATVRFS